MAIRMAGLKELEEMVENTLHDREIHLLKDLTRARKRRKSGCLSWCQRNDFTAPSFILLCVFAKFLVVLAKQSLQRVSLVRYGQTLMTIS
jgi:hypothetical protein